MRADIYEDERRLREAPKVFGSIRAGIEFNMDS